MMVREGTLPEGTALGDTEAPTEPARPINGPDQPVMTLRGAGVEVDGRRVALVAVGLCLVTLAVLAAVFFVAGARKNSQIAQLQQHGVPVVVTVLPCQGELGGSGSNPAGYACQGTFVLDGHRYNDSLPGNAIRIPGSKLRGVTVPGDPALLSTPGILATQHSSWKVFVLPIVLVILVLLVGVLLLRRRHLRQAR
jgi:hypothetical protein